MESKIRVGIVGATVTPGGSGWGANAHVPALNGLPDYELKAVCPQGDRARLGGGFGAALAFHNFDEMVAHPPEVESRLGGRSRPGTPRFGRQSSRSGEGRVLRNGRSAPPVVEAEAMA